jgi:monoamine oxidase
VGGWAKTIEWLAEPLEIRKSEPVTAVAWDTAAGVTVTTAQGTYTGSHVIVTAPLGVLKVRKTPIWPRSWANFSPLSSCIRTAMHGPTGIFWANLTHFSLKAGAIDFEGGLPQAKLDAIGRLGVGDIEKVALTYETTWWGSGGGGEGAVFIDAASEMTFPLWLDFSAHYGAPTLIVVYSASFAKDVQTNWSDEEIIAGARSTLAAIFGQNPEPVATALSHWTASPFTRGAYSTIPVGATVADLAALAAPVDGRVLFAGEATAYEPFWAASAHGAFHSGLREAKRLGITDFGIPGIY